MTMLTSTTSIADTFTQLLIGEIPFRFTAYDGSSAGPEDAAYGLHLKTERGLSYLLSAPGDLGLSRAYVSGDLDVVGAHPGDPYDALMAIKGGAAGLKFRIPSPVEALGLVRSVGLANLKPPLFVHVLSGQATLLHADDEPLTPELATVLYHEVIVTGEKTAAPPVESRNDPVAQPDTWIVRGRVTDKAGKGLNKLIVSVYDKDLLFDDKLGQTETDSNGDYTLTYHTEDYRDIIERKPDIYVKVLDQKGNTLYSSKKKIKFNVGRVEIVNVVIG